MKKVIGICGSPRVGGNTDILVHEVLKGASDVGCETEYIALSGLSVLPCIACGACKTSRTCIHKDDMPGLIEKIKAADVVVLGTPVYYWGPTAQMKTFTDRWHCDGLGLFSGKTVILAVAMEDTDVRTARHVIGMYEDALDYLNADLKTVVLAAGAHHKGDVLAMPDCLARAFEAGKNV